MYELKCPYCGHEQEYQGCFEEEEDLLNIYYECELCEKEFLLAIEFYPTFDTSPLEDDTGT